MRIGNKILLFSYLLVLFCSLQNVAIAQNNSLARAGGNEGHMYMGYCSYSDDSFLYGKGYLKTQLVDNEIGHWARYARSYINELKNCKILGIRVGVAADIRRAKVAIKDKLRGTSIRSKEVDLKKGWNIVMFDEPLNAGDFEVVFGYEYRQENVPQDNPFVVASDNNFGAPRDSHYITIDNTRIQNNVNESGALCIQLIVTGPSEIIDNRADLQQIRQLYVLDKNKNVQLLAKVRNEGANTIDNIEIRVVRGTKVIGRTKANANIPVLGEKTITLDGVSANNGDELKVDIWAVNGKRITSKQQTILIKDIVRDGMERTVLVEMFSTLKCSSCPKAHENIHALIDREKYNDRICWITHHAGYLPDVYSLAESKYLELLYGEESPFAPAICFDRRITDFGKTFKKAQFHNPAIPASGDASPFMRNFFEEALSRPAVASIELKREFNPDQKKLFIEVTGKVLPEHVDKDDLYVNIVLVENDIETREQAGTGKDDSGKLNPFILTGVPRIFGCGKDGAKVSLNSDNTYSYKAELSVDEKWDYDNVEVIAFLAKSPAKGYANCEVYNSTKVTLTPSNALFIEGNRGQLSVNEEGSIVYSENGADIQVYTLEGLRIANTSLPAGIYIVKVKPLQGEVFARKIMVN